MRKLPILDASGTFLGRFYYCCSIPNSIGQKLASKAALKVARNATESIELPPRMAPPGFPGGGQGRPRPGGGPNGGVFLVQ